MAIHDVAHLSIRTSSDSSRHKNKWWKLARSNAIFWTVRQIYGHITRMVTTAGEHESLAQILNWKVRVQGPGQFLIRAEKTLGTSVNRTRVTSDVGYHECDVT